MVKCPQLFGLRAEQIERKAGVIASELGLTREQLSTLTERYPRVLTYSLPDNLLPKIQYLAREMEFELADLSLEIVEYPLILGYSLEKRIKARHEHLAKCNVLVRPRSVKRAVRSAAKVRQGGDADGAGPRGTDGDGAQDTRAGGVAPEARGTRVIGLRSMLTPADAVFYARYREQPSLIRWLNLGTINSDPYGVPKEEEFSVDLAHLH